MDQLISLIVLAAGKSTRTKENKLLRKVDGETLIERVVKSAIASSVDEVVVVVGHEADRVRGALRGLRCSFVYNEDYEKGQSFSVRAGLAFVRDRADAVMVLPGDVALIKPEMIDKVLTEYRRSKPPIVIASYQGRSGHPILLDRSLFGEIMQIREETLGLRAVSEKHKHELRYVDVGSAEVLVDIDTEEDFRRHF